MKEKLPISVIICVKNGQKTIEACIISSIKNDPQELIIIDGGSIDNTIKIAKKYTKKIYYDNGKGLAFARQIGAEMASQEFIVYIDSDTELPKETILHNMFDELQKKNWAAIRAQIIDPRQEKTFFEQAEDFHWRNRLNRAGEHNHMYLSTIVCLIKKNIVIKYKFDPSFDGAAEDRDFFRRIKNEYNFGIAKEVAYHYHRSSCRNFFMQRLLYGKGDAKSIVKHKAKAINIFCYPFGDFLIGIALCIYKGKPKYIPFYIIRVISIQIGSLAGIGSIIRLALNKKIQDFHI